eukprot:jgi/Tetstr1/444780/TSEL_032628.t1
MRAGRKCNARPAFAMPNKKAHMMRWHTAQPNGEASQPGSSAQDGGNGDGEEDDSVTYGGEFEVARGSKGAAWHEISSPDTSKAAEPGMPPERRPRSTPLKIPGSDAHKL